MAKIFKEKGEVMKPYHVLGTTLIVVGIVLFIFGIAATQQPGQKLVWGMTGYFTNKTLWFLVGGAALVAGGFGVRRIK